MFLFLACLCDYMMSVNLLVIVANLRYTIVYGIRDILVSIINLFFRIKSFLWRRQNHSIKDGLD